MASPAARPAVRGFLSYARQDRRLVDRFRRLLDPRLAIDRGLEFSVWWDADILIGEHWETRIREAMAAADFALLLVSPAFLSRPYITTVEIPALLTDPSTLVMPVGLQWIDFARTDLRGLGAHQIFRLQIPGEEQPRFFSECWGQNAARFSDALAAQVSTRCSGQATRP